MARVLVLLVLCLASGAARAGTGAGILFKDLAGAIPEDVAEAIYHDHFASFLTPSADGTELQDEGGRPTWFRATLKDLNRDGIEEIFVIGGNLYLSGHAGGSIWLFVRAADGSYGPQLGFPATDYEILPEVRGGFPDLKFGGPGFCHPIWGWNGSEYSYLRKEGACGN